MQTNIFSFNAVASNSRIGVVGKKALTHMQFTGEVPVYGIVGAGRTSPEFAIEVENLNAQAQEAFIAWAEGQAELKRKAEAEAAELKAQAQALEAQAQALKAKQAELGQALEAEAQAKAQLAAEAAQALALAQAQAAEALAKAEAEKQALAEAEAEKLAELDTAKNAELDKLRAEAAQAQAKAEALLAETVAKYENPSTYALLQGWTIIAALVTLLVTGLVVTYLNHHNLSFLFTEGDKVAFPDVILWLFSGVLGLVPLMFVFMEDKEMARKGALVLPIDLVATVALFIVQTYGAEDVYAVFTAKNLIALIAAGGYAYLLKLIVERLQAVTTNEMDKKALFGILNWMFKGK